MKIKQKEAGICPFFKKHTLRNAQFSEIRVLFKRLKHHYQTMKLLRLKASFPDLTPP